MIAVDTNLLVYAHRSDSPWHVAAAHCVRELAETARWAIPWPCIAEFWAIVTHPRIYRPASTIDQTVRQIEVWLGSPTVTLLAETEQGWPALREIIRTGKVVGPAVHDARIAALCASHGVTELWSCDRDFSRFGALRVVNPLVPGRAGERKATYRVGRSAR